MPVNDSGQGNSPNTPVKQKSLRYFLEVHAGVVANIFKNPKNSSWVDPHYYYIDTNAGTGRNDDGSDGSVLLAQRILRKHGHRACGIAIEKSSDAVAALRDCLHGTTDFTVHHGDNAALVDMDLLTPKAPGAKYGLMYSDPNGVNDFPLPAVARFFGSTYTTRIDFLLSIGANHLKRCYAAGLHKYLLRDIMEQINKDCWYIREGYWRDQWTLLFGTNWDKWKPLTIPVNGIALKGLSSLGLYKVNSVKGKQVLDDLSFTRAEIEKKSLLPLIPPTVSISPTPNFLL